MPPTLQIQFLGDFRLFFLEGKNGDAQPLPTPPTLNSQSLLAYLIVNRKRPHPREMLIGMFWGSRPARKARHSLATALWHIRRCFSGLNPIRGYAQTIQFEFPGEIKIDSEIFEAHVNRRDRANLQKAIEYFKGDFLIDFYDDWIITERYRLHTQFIEGLANLMVIQEADDEHELARHTAQHLLEIDPLREDAHRMVMRTNCALGQRNSALEQYDNCYQTLKDELAIEPVTETTNLFKAIRDGIYPIGQVSLTTLGPYVRTGLPHGQSPLDVVTTHKMVGRSHEIAFLEAQWSAAQEGQGSLVFVTGEAGVGKTRLVEQFTQNPGVKGIRVLTGRCYEFEHLLPYQPIAEALRPWLADLPEDNLTHLPGWVLEELSRLVPELTLRPGINTAIGRGQDQARLFSAVLYFLSLLFSRSPLLIILEDMHWATASMLELFHYLVRRLAEKPVLLIGTYRSDNVSNQYPLPTLQRGLSKEGLAHHLPLARLSEADVEQLMSEMSGAGEAVANLARRLNQETEGNPFFLLEMVKTLFETKAITLSDGFWEGDFDRISRRDLTLPASVSEAIRARVSRMSEAAQEALGMAAVLGREFDFEPLAAAWNAGEELTLDALDEMLRHRIIDEGTGSINRDYTFTHHKIQEVVYAGIPRHRRQRAHARVAVAMETHHALNPEDVLSELAHHFEQAQSLEPALMDKAIMYLQQSGDQAANQFANTEAVDYFTRALKLTPETEQGRQYRLLRARERIYDLLGNREKQAQDIDTLWVLAKNLGVEKQAEVMLCRARYAREIGAYQKAVGAAQAAIEFAQTDQQLLASEGFMIMGTALIRQGDNNTAQTKFQKGLTLARAAGSTRLEAYCLNGLGLTSQYLGHPLKARHFLGEASTLYREIGDLRGLSAALNNLGVIANEQGDNVSARRFYQDAVEIHRKAGNRKSEAMVLGNLGVIAAAQGIYSQALDDHQKALQGAREVGHQLFEGNALLNLGTVFLYLGAYPEAGDSYAEARRVYQEIGNQTGIGWWLVYSCLLAHRLGDQEVAIESAREALRLAEEIGDRHIQAYAWTHLGHGLDALGHFDEAGQAYQNAVSIRRDLDEPHLAIESLSGLARVYLRRGWMAQALAVTDEVISFLKDASLDGTDEPLRIHLSCYQVLHAKNDPRASRILSTAYSLLAEQASLIEDENLKRSFLERVPAHKKILAAITKN